MSWSPATEERASALLARYPQRRSAVMPLLYLAMHEEGRLSDVGMRRVAELTGLTPAQVRSVATFYSMYKHDAGRYVVSVCGSIACYLLGADGVLAAVEDETGVRSGETGADGVFTVERVECIGACGGAPAMQVNYEMVEGVTPDQGRSLCRWLRDQRPRVVRSDDLQDRFGGRRSFDWGPEDRRGAIGPVPAFGPYGTAGEEA
jgi:NADH:ubiquinone oxidoreductase subunit E